MTFTIQDVGCYADGSFGHEHVRERLAVLFAEHYQPGPVAMCNEKVEILEALKGPMSDDAWEEYSAIEALNEECCDDAVYFTLEAGDLLLVADEDWQPCSHCHCEPCQCDRMYEDYVDRKLYG